MTNPNYTDISVLLDRSGSMHAIKTDTEGGFAAFIEEQKKTPGRCQVTLAQFDDQYEVVYSDQPLASVPALHLQPRGSTALLDAIGRLITSTGERLAAMPEADRPGSVIVVIMTDGLENASREFTGAAVKGLIAEQSEKYGWTFVYLGANQDAIAVGESLGVNRDRSMTYAGPQAAAAMRATGANISSYRQKVASGVGHDEALASSVYTQEQREAATGEPDRASNNPRT